MWATRVARALLDGPCEVQVAPRLGEIPGRDLEMDADAGTVEPPEQCGTEGSRDIGVGADHRGPRGPGVFDRRCDVLAASEHDVGVKPPGIMPARVWAVDDRHAHRRRRHCVKIEFWVVCHEHVAGTGRRPARGEVVDLPAALLQPSADPSAVAMRPASAMRSGSRRHVVPPATRSRKTAL